MPDTPLGVASGTSPATVRRLRYSRLNDLPVNLPLVTPSASTSGSYSHTTLQNLIDQTAQELGDTAKIFYVQQELQFNLQEALTVWNMLTGWNRTTDYFTTQPGVAFYDLTKVLPTQPLTRAYTWQDAVGRMQYRLMEPYDPVNFTGLSEMFTGAGLVRSLQQRRNRFLSDTQSIVTLRLPIPIGAGAGLVRLDDHTITLARAVWKAADGHYTSLDVTDESMATSFIPSWRQSKGIPRCISLVFQPELNLQLIPEPVYPGEVHLLTVESGTDLSTQTNSILNLPDDSMWGVAWGAMADLLLRDGIGRAPSLSSFCSSMYALCSSLTRELPSVIGTTINDKMAAPSSLDMLDSIKPGWEGQSWGRPERVGIMADFLALQPVPDSIYSIGVTVVRSTPIYQLTDQIQLGREQLAAIVGWAKQISLFKKGGQQLKEGVQAAQELIAVAKTYNEERVYMSSYLSELYSLASDYSWSPVREVQPVSQGVESDRPDTSSTRQPRRRLGGR